MACTFQEMIMFKNYLSASLGVVGFVFCLTWSLSASAGGPKIQGKFGTGAFAVQETDSLESITDVITGILSPLVPPSTSQSLPSVSLPSIGTLNIDATTVESNFESTSKTTANTITILIGSPTSDTINISAASSETKAHCEDVYPKLHSSTSVGTVTVNGAPIVVTGERNQKISLPNSGGVMTLNQRNESRVYYSGYVFANAVNVHLSSQERDRIIAHTEGYANCF